MLEILGKFIFPMAQIIASSSIAEPTKVLVKSIK